jgi:hypothetical protein
MFPHFLDSRLADGSDVLALRACCLLPPGRFLVLISVWSWVGRRVLVQLEWIDQLKNPMTSSGIEPVTFRSTNCYICLLARPHNSMFILTSSLLLSLCCTRIVILQSDLLSLQRKWANTMLDHKLTSQRLANADVPLNTHLPHTHTRNSIAMIFYQKKCKLYEQTELQSHYHLSNLHSL